MYTPPLLTAHTVKSKIRPTPETITVHFTHRSVYEHSIFRIRVRGGGKLQNLFFKLVQNLLRHTLRHFVRYAQLRSWPGDGNEVIDNKPRGLVPTTVGTFSIMSHSLKPPEAEHR